ncbi:unnamed protein product, partial [Gulo gulo]
WLFPGATLVSNGQRRKGSAALGDSVKLQRCAVKKFSPRLCERMEKCEPKPKNESTEESPNPTWEWVQPGRHCL